MHGIVGGDVVVDVVVDEIADDEWMESAIFGIFSIRGMHEPDRFDDRGSEYVMIFTNRRLA